MFWFNSSCWFLSLVPCFLSSLRFFTSRFIPSSCTLCFRYLVPLLFPPFPLFLTFSLNSSLFLVSLIFPPLVFFIIYSPLLVPFVICSLVLVSNFVSSPLVTFLIAPTPLPVSFVFSCIFFFVLLVYCLCFPCFLSFNLFSSV